MPAQTFGIVLFTFFICTSLAQAQLPHGVVDTQPNGDRPPTPQESLAKITVPTGFRVSLFAGEPDVHQPIAMEFDDRGRLWVVECYSYPDWNNKGKDRILIFEDEDNDGQFDKRSIFAENLSNITGFALGFGGVWACSTPNFIFIPDANNDDRPDGPAVIKLDGWNDSRKDVRHNVFNGMKWGPDGWMYGGHGILADSLVGKPGTPENQRHRMNCGIWRFHPVTEKFEIVAHGTTNPWGIDFDEYGQGFFTNSVIGHFWHLIPGARYERMYGTHFSPYAYALIDSCSDHLHWGDGTWQDSRGGKGMHSEAGGGHAHVGAMIYRGGTWPEEYHGSLFTSNLHGNRLNRDVVHRKGSGYVASHAPDFFHGNDPWLRGIGVKYGPDGNVYVSDWTDLGECHDKDGTHRSSGRIYKITYGKSEASSPRDLRKESTATLAELMRHENAWYWYHARRILHERATAGEDMSAAIANAKQRLANGMSSPLKLSTLNMLSLIGGTDAAYIKGLLRSSDEHVQSWAVRQLADVHGLDTQSHEQLIEMIPTASAQLKLEIASLLQKTPEVKRWSIVTALLRNFPTKDDPNMLPMTWLAIEGLASERDRLRFVQLSQIGQDNVQLSPLRQFIARRALADAPTDRETIDLILAVAKRANRPSRIDLLRGIGDALEAEGLDEMPKEWASVRRVVGESDSTQIRRLIDELSIKFQDAGATERLRRLAMNSQSDSNERTTAIEILAENRVDGILSVLLGLLGDSAVRQTAIESLGRFNDPSVPMALLARFAEFGPAEKEAAITTLVISRDHARALLQAIESGSILSTAVKPAQAAAIYQLGDSKLREQLHEHWGDLRASSQEKQQKIADWKATLGREKLAEANLLNGARVYDQNCGKCHKLFGKGGDIGPDLTGSDRRDLDYILQNVITPSAVVGKDFRMHTMLLNDGRVISGALREQTKTTIVVQTAEKQTTIPRSEIVSLEPSELSLMPEGQFDALPKEAVRDLVAFLASDPK